MSRSAPASPKAIHRPGGERPAARRRASPQAPSFAEMLRRRRKGGADQRAGDPVADSGPDGQPVELAEEGTFDERPADEGGAHHEGESAMAESPRTDVAENPARGAILEASWLEKLVPGDDQLDALLDDIRRAQRVATTTARGMVQALAGTIAAFCNDPAVASGQSWQARIPLREDVLPETTLALSISSFWLLLRFETSHPLSRELVSNHRAELAAVLEDSLDKRREIDIALA